MGGGVRKERDEEREREERDSWINYGCSDCVGGIERGGRISGERRLQKRRGGKGRRAIRRGRRRRQRKAKRKRMTS